MKKIIKYSLILIIIDQLIKVLISANLKINTTVEIINNFFSLTYVKNIGAAFSILKGNRYFLILIALLALICIYIFFIENKELRKKDIIVYTLIISGIIGNLIDRIIYGYVVDYMSFEIFNYSVPIFNFADSLIVVGCILLFYITLLEEKNARI